MAGSRSKKSTGVYDNPGIPKMVDSTKYEKMSKYAKPKDAPLGSGMAKEAAKDIQEMKNKRFPDPDKY